jgi:lambda repressor-like predicted transcriptional regulator
VTLSEYLKHLGWSVATLGREAGIDYRTATKAFNGEKISSNAARDIASALSEAMGRTIQPGEIRGLNY